MKYKILLPLLVSGIFFNACSKDEAETKAPGDTILETYYPGNSIEIKELAIYTQDGVVTDPAFIQGFIDRNVYGDAKSRFYVGVTSIPVPASSQVLHMLNDSRVNVNGTNMVITGYHDSLMLVSEYTSTTISTNLSGCSLLAAKIPQYNAFTDCPEGTCSSYRKVTPLVIAGSNYYAPLLTYAVVTKDCSATATEMPMINVVNSDLKSMLTAGDSVLIQYAKLALVKKGKD
jgi:hypothetical protein